MIWETIFSIANVWPLPFWLLLAIGPRTEMTGRIILFGGIAMLAAAYTILCLLLLSNTIDPGGRALPAAAEMTQLTGVMAFFASKGGAVVGWIHYLAFDLFVGVWIARNADRHGFGRAIQIFPLLFSWAVGPVGLLLYLLMRLSSKAARQNGAAPC